MRYVEATISGIENCVGDIIRGGNFRSEKCTGDNIGDDNFRDRIVGTTITGAIIPKVINAIPP